MKKLTILAAVILAASVVAPALAIAQHQNGERAPNGTENRLPGERDPRQGVISNGVNETVVEIGERASQIAGEHAEQIRERVEGGNFTGEEIASIAKEIGVRVRAVVMTQVEELRNQTYQRMQQETDPDKVAEEAQKLGRAGRFDYAHDNFVTEAEEIVEEAKERGIEVEELNETLDEISIAYGQMYRSEDPREKAGEMQQLAQEFRNQLEEAAGDQESEIREQAQQRMQEHRPALEAMRNQTWDNMKGMSLTVLENRIRSAENRINAIEKSIEDADTTELQEKLDEIREKEDELEQAYEEQDREQIQQVTEDISILWEEFRSLFRQTQRERTLEHSAEKLEETLNKTEQLIEMAQERGLDTAELQASQEGIENGLTQAREAIENQNYGTAQERIQEVRNQFEDYREQAKGLASQLRAQQEGGR